MVDSSNCDVFELVFGYFPDSRLATHAAGPRAAEGSATERDGINDRREGWTGDDERLPSHLETSSRASRRREDRVPSNAPRSARFGPTAGARRAMARGEESTTGTGFGRDAGVGLRRGSRRRRRPVRGQGRTRRLHLWVCRVVVGIAFRSKRLRRGEARSSLGWIRRRRRRRRIGRPDRPAASR